MKDFQHITFLNMAKWRKKRVVSDSLTGDLCVLSLETFEIEKVIELPRRQNLQDKGMIYSNRLVSYGDWLHMFPDVTARSVISYNILTGESILTPPIYVNDKRYRMPAPGFVSGRYFIQLTDMPEKRFHVFDMENIRYIDDSTAKPKITSSLNRIKKSLMPYLYYHEGISYVGVLDDNKIFFFDWERDESGFVDLPFVLSSDVTGFSCDGTYCWIYQDGHGQIARVSNADTTQYVIFDIGNMTDVYPMIDFDGKLLLCRWGSETYRDICIFDKETGSLSSMKKKLPKALDIFDDLRAATIGAYGGYELMTDGVRLYPGAVNMLLDIDLKHERVIGKEITVKYDREAAVKKSILDYYAGQIISESDIMQYGLFKDGLSYLL